MSMRRLGVDHLDLFQLHEIDPKVPLADQVGELKNLRDEGKVAAVGLSRVTVAQLAEAQQIVPIASVQGRFNVADQDARPILKRCERDEMVFIPWAPLAQDGLSGDGSPWPELARERGVSIQQLALAWLLATSPSMLPIPGTSRRDHLDDNLRAADVHLTVADLQRLNSVSAQ